MAKCSCIGTYIGDECETNACEGITCQNEGLCIVENGAAKCDCKNHFFGDFCIQHPCDSFCANDAKICSIDNGVPRCECKVSYSGRKCECPPVYRRQKDSSGNFLKKNGDDAKKYCSDQGGFLTFFINEKEHEEYTKTQRENPTDEWIGYTQKYPEDKSQYLTVDNEDAIYRNWADWEPNSKNEHCVELYGEGHQDFATGEMNDLDCEIELEFACRFSRYCP